MYLISHTETRISDPDADALHHQQQAETPDVELCLLVASVYFLQHGAPCDTHEHIQTVLSLILPSGDPISRQVRSSEQLRETGLTCWLNLTREDERGPHRAAEREREREG